MTFHWNLLRPLHPALTPLTVQVINLHAHAPEKATNMHTYVRAYIHTCSYMYTDVFRCAYACIYVYICIYVHEGCCKGHLSCSYTWADHCFLHEIFAKEYAKGTHFSVKVDAFVEKQLE